MNINITLIGQALTFAILVWFTMKFVWPLIMAAIDEREKTIADGLSAADRGRYELAQSKKISVKELKNAKAKANKIIEQAEAQASKILADAKIGAEQQHQRMVDEAQHTIKLNQQLTKQELKQEMAGFMVQAVEQLMQQQLSTDVDQKMLQQMLAKW